MALIDPMVFEDLRDSIENLLTANQSIYFRTVGEQKQSSGAEEVKGNLRSVQVFFSEGKNSQQTRTQFEHTVNYQLFFTAAAAATADLATLDSPSSSVATKKAILLASTAGSRIADRLIDSLYRMVVQIIMDPVNEDLGLDKYTVSNRRIMDFRKNQPIDHGNLIVLTAQAQLTATITELTIGATPTPAVQPAIGLESQFTTINGDPTSSTASQIGIDIDTT